MSTVPFARLGMVAIVAAVTIVLPIRFVQASAFAGFPSRPQIEQKAKWQKNIRIPQRGQPWHPLFSPVAKSSENNQPTPIEQSPSLLEKKGGILYRTSIFDRSELAQIRQDLAEYERDMQDETMSSVAQHRRGAVLSSVDSPTVQVLREGSLVEWVRTVTSNPNYVLRDQDVPVELRSYEKRGASMAWHSDDVLFDPPQLEVVWTLENTSDCVTMWKQPEQHGPNDSSKTTNIHTIETDPNAVLLIAAGGPEHCVTSLKQGRRIIVKCVYALRDAVFLSHAHQAQFQNKKGSKSNNKKNKKRQRR
mmetsp:Transcript_2261/g.4751  ORF Transcript_2261/g.4751 Transcript_2261/m.4751 type:complete len:305 (-) Transcript_2261:336-1250(-)